MHDAIASFLARMKLMCGPAFNVDRVVEFGSHDINGTPRRFFSSAKEYVGVDWRPGPGVDVVSLAHEYEGCPDGHFQFAVATSLLEHDPYWRETVERMCDLVGFDGSIVITCAGPGFHEHERETSPAFSGNFMDHGVGSYYRNLTAHDVVSELTRCARFQRIAVEDDPEVKDVRVFAIGKMPGRAGVPEGMDQRSGQKFGDLAEVE